VWLQLKVETPMPHPHAPPALAALLLVTGPLAGCASSETRPRAPNRVSVALEQDFGIVAGRGVCSKTAQLEEGFACFRAKGSQYHGTPLPGASSDVAGVGAATTRVLLGYDRVVLRGFTLGLRGGLVVRGGGPKPDGEGAPSFLRFHGEGRAAYWFGRDPFARTGLRFGLFVAGGLAQVDTPFRITVEEDTTKPPSAAQPTNPRLQTLDVFKKSGTGFVGGGAAVACAVSRSSAFFLHLKAMRLFPSDGTVLAPEIGYEHGF
jgi:hypothetical protein